MNEKTSNNGLAILWILFRVGCIIAFFAWIYHAFDWL